MRSSSLCLVGWVTYGLKAYAGGKVTLGRFDPIQALVPKELWLSCVDESGFRCEGDLGVERRASETDQIP